MLFKKVTLLWICTLLITLFSFNPSLQASTAQTVSSEEAIILLLYPEIEKQVAQYYKEYISNGSTIAPYAVNVIDL